MLKINPFYLLMLFYLIVNFIFAIIGFNSNRVDIELTLFNLKSSSFFVAFIFQLLACCIIFIVFFIFKQVKGIRNEFYIYNKGAFVLFSFQLLFLLYNAYYGTNIAGVSVKATNPILNTFFVLLPADLFYILFSPFIKSNKLFSLNSILFIVSSTLRGWMGGVLLVFFIYACRKEFLRVSLKNLIVYLFFFVLVLFLVPYLVLMKWAMRSNDSIFSIFEVVDKNSYITLLDESLYFIFNRFQHNYHIALIWENSEKLIQAYNSNRILPYWGEGVIQTIFLKIFGTQDTPTLAQAMVYMLFSSRGDWNSNPGLAGWLIILQESFIFYILYIVIILSLGFFIAKKFYGNKMLLLVGVFSVFYLFHGWIGAYVTMITYLLFFTIISKVKFRV
ncbi:oligosaccharide repeat unit polymerase [Acinetobacter sp. CFCC 11171]|uniref:oligosaccharide repeat unit polymerase n=1 Tax=Acinetobacter sp. CFCC 11171 TaxID=1775558 RepID=UPI000DD0C8E4|nr:oligosaccharide repeat unit polymerase [Acinetobacter sp. CFCC 11171]